MEPERLHALLDSLLNLIDFVKMDELFQNDLP